MRATRAATKESAPNKQGASSKAFGKRYGHKMTHDMVEACVEGYARHSRPGVPMTMIYVAAMIEEFGCKVRIGPLGISEFFHPEDNSFPSFRQFRYHVIKSVGLENVQKNRTKSARRRRGLTARKGGSE